MENASAYLAPESGGQYGLAGKLNRVLAVRAADKDPRLQWRRCEACARVEACRFHVIRPFCLPQTGESYVPAGAAV
jgi:hypothetical protein